MLIEFAYGAREFKHWSASYNNYQQTLRDVITEWGAQHSRGGNGSTQLIKISDSLLFGLVTSGLPTDCILYYDVLGKKMYLTGRISNIYDYRNNNMGYAKTTGHSKSPHDSFDWGECYRQGDSDFCFEVPDECFEDFYDEIKPYYEYDFKKCLTELCGISFNCIVDESPAPSSGMNTRDAFYLDCTSWFWEVLMYDMYEGNLYQEYLNAYPRTVEPLVNLITNVQNYFLTHGQNSYDPRD